jgi:hypothetical protein
MKKILQKIQKEDNQQRIKVTLSLLFQLSKIIMATLLVIFVPQKCPENPDGMCSFIDNFIDLTLFNSIVLAWNFFTLAVILLFYRIEYVRERWCIKYLDVDDTIPNDNLKNEITQYDEISYEMYTHNKKYNYWIHSTIVIYIVNLILSGILIYRFYYLDYRSITVLLTNFILIIEKLYNSYEIAKKSSNNTLAYSAYLVTFVNYNCIDNDYRHKDLQQYRNHTSEDMIENNNDENERDQEQQMTENSSEHNNETYENERNANQINILYEHEQ